MDAADYKEESILNHQCILCFDYEHRCPVAGFTYQHMPKPVKAVDYSRRSFLKTGGVFFGGLLFGSVFSIFDKTVKTSLLRPPGVSKETEFVQRCLRCFQCVESCPNQIIKITRFEAGFDSLFTPHLEFREYGCDYNCQVCQLVCPNFAIPRQTLSDKQQSKIGLASIDQDLCVVFAQDTNCLVCEEFCPIPEKAIKIDEKSKLINGRNTVLKYPVVDKTLCIGCGICEAFCPVYEKAIRVFRT
jgi:MauM/NapG family ferredoxin protein